MPSYKMANSLLRNTVCLTLHVTPNWSRMTQPISLGFRLCSRICLYRNGSLLRGGKGEELFHHFKQVYMHPGTGGVLAC